MRNLVRRYVTVEQRKSDNQGVTEDDVNEIKQDISAFRCELIEVLKNSGMNTSTATGVGQGISYGSVRGKLKISLIYLSSVISVGKLTSFIMKAHSFSSFPASKHARLCVSHSDWTSILYLNLQCNFGPFRPNQPILLRVNLN